MTLPSIVACPECHARNRIDPARAAAARCGRCGEALAASGGRPVVLDDATFDAALRDADRPVIVDFWAGWCGPCRAFAPTLEAFAKESGARVLVAKVDVDAAPRTAAKLGIQSIPTIVLFRDGREAARKVGAMTGPELARFAAG
jgi:thioredoxin 2